MSKLTARLKDLLRSFAASIRRYPLELALCLVWFTLYCLRNPLGDALKQAGFTVDFEQLNAYCYPHILLLFALLRLKGRHWAWMVLSGLMWLLWVPLMLWGTPTYGWTVGIFYLLAALALFAGASRMDNVSFGRHILHTALHVLEALLVGVMLNGVAFAIITSVFYLFGLGDDWDIVFNPAAACIWVVVVPMLCCTLLDELLPAGEDRSVSEKFLDILVDKVLSPALLLYAVILYGYMIRILIRWQLPDGGVAYMVLGFLCVALVCYLLRLQCEKRHFEWFYRAFPALAVPPLVLLWIGVSRRMGEYGITDTRFYLLVLSVLVTLFVILLIRERSRRFQDMALLMGACAILFTFIPGIRARDFGIRSQAARLESLLPEVLASPRRGAAAWRARPGVSSGRRSGESPSLP